MPAHACPHARAACRCPHAGARVHVRGMSFADVGGSGRGRGVEEAGYRGGRVSERKFLSSLLPWLAAGVVAVISRRGCCRDQPSPCRGAPGRATSCLPLSEEAAWVRQRASERRRGLRKEGDRWHSVQLAWYWQCSAGMAACYWQCSAGTMGSVQLAWYA